MIDPVLSKRRVDPEKVAELRAHFDELDDERDVFERGLELEDVHTEAAFLREDEDGPDLYYYTERGEDYPPDIEMADVEDEAVLALGEKHGETLDDACVESAHEDGELKRFETLFFASTIDRNE